ncbi:MAG: S8 family serine peptidase [Rhodospirillales bacterium]|nr:S8 family serine peptidase [Alphaproteobacteria bacterium]MCB9986764.1 S8 family serine peptidase [Rhodospirillales bacterium]USO08465.1 MAG: S8 family serine peptidase [Rhodospirillales bacterium]
MTLPTDDRFVYQTNLLNTAGGIDIDVVPAWTDYTGAGVSIALIDDGFDLAHPDLAGRFDLAASYDFAGSDPLPQAETGDDHGTAIAGIAAAARNGVGIVGVAYDATLVGLRVSFTADDSTDQFTAAMTHMVDNDIASNSWGYAGAFADNYADGWLDGQRAAIEDAAFNGRGGLGTVILFAAGNGGNSADRVDYHSVTADPHVIAVGAMTATGAAASFSNPGAALLVSAPGQSIPTDDVSGAGGYFPGDYVSLSGTSAATPEVSGIVALMLEANPNLGYRDVQEILAYSARATGAVSDWQTNGADNWNGTGLHFSHSVGFGLVDALAAVRLAETWTTTHTEANLRTIDQTYTGPAVPIPDGTGRIDSTITISGDLILDHVQVSVDITHAAAAQLDIALISPSGTRSILMSAAPVTGAMSEFTFTTVADWGEHATGVWTLEVADHTAGTAGILNGWSINLQGDAATNNNLYVYTDENTNPIAVTDSNGGTDTINAAAISHALTLDLAARTGIENLDTGDGNDTVYGSALDNVIDTGRGNDTIYASVGSDTIDGGAGTDTYITESVFNHNVAVDADGTVTLTSLDTGIATHLLNIENFVFAGVSYDLPSLAAASRSGDLVDVIYFIHGAAGIAGMHSDTLGHTAYEAGTLGVGGTGTVLLADREGNHLTLTNNAGQDLSGLSMRMDDGLAVTLHGFIEVTVIADGTSATSVDIGGGQQGFIQTGAGGDTVNFLGFLIDPHIPAQDRTLTANTNDGNDRVTVTDRSGYIAYDIDLGSGDDTFTAIGTPGGTVHGGDGADTFAFGAGAQNAVIDDFNPLLDHLDLSALTAAHQGAIDGFLTLTTSQNATTVSVGGTNVATLAGTVLDQTLQHYLDTGVVIVD